MRGILGLLVVLLVVGSVMPGAAAERKIISPPGADVGLPFSPGILSGDFLYLSGAIGNKPGTTEVSGDIQAQTRQTMGNLGVILEAAGMDFSRVVSASVFLSDARHFQAFNDVYRTYFPKDPPARATVQADIALPAALVEISMVAVRPGIERKVITPKGMMSPELPYSWGILAGNTLFISGATSRDPKTYQPVAGDVPTQTRQVLQNIGAVLEEAGMTHRDVVSCKVFLDEARYFQDMNDVYRTFFPQDPPARATVRAKLMNPAFSTEIQCVAVKDPGRKVVASEGAPRSTSPLSPAIQVGERLFISGFLGRGAEGYGDIKAQTRQTLENLRATLHAAGMDFTNVVEAMVYLSDIRYYQAMNEVYREVVPSPKPARATVGTQLMAPEAVVEILMVAAR